MWKLFFKNKMTEIANWFYNRRYEIIFFLACILLTMAVCGCVALFSISSMRTQLIMIISLVVLFLTIFVGIPIINWIKHNYRLAKNGIEVKADWK